MLRGKRRLRLSRAALETMAIIAYKQPVTKSEVEAIRGVDASGVLATLLERNLVTIKGRSTMVGRPLLYGSTDEFLNYFGLRDLAELPRPEELRALVAAREPEQLEMMELDPGSGMPLALTAGDGVGEGAALVAGDAPAGEASGTDAEEVFSLADADAAIAHANAARAEAAMAIAHDHAPAASVHAGAGDLAEAADDGAADEYDEDEFEGEDEDDEFDDAYEDDDDEDDDDEEAEDEDGERPSLSVDDSGGH
jgi:segregation and condensation protein B